MSFGFLPIVTFVGADSSATHYIGSIYPITIKSHKSWADGEDKARFFPAKSRRRFSNLHNHYLASGAYYPISGDWGRSEDPCAGQERCLRHLSICLSLSNMLQ